MFQFIKKCFFAVTFLTSIYSLSCISMNNQACKVRQEIIVISN